MRSVSKRYDQYCPVAHALGLVGERWALLIVRELLHGPQRYTDLTANLPKIGTNILSSRLKDLEACGIVAKRRLPPPAASQVYELTEYGHALKPVIRELAIWGLRSLGPPSLEDAPAPHWLEHGLDTVFAPVAPAGSFEFHVGEEVASIVEGEARPGPLEAADVVVRAPDPAAFYHLFVDGIWDGIEVEGDRDLLERLLDAASAPGAPVPTAA
jgi:DNA-binding HxlR family transcriptional regulator